MGRKLNVELRLEEWVKAHDFIVESIIGRGGGRWLSYVLPSDEGTVEHFQKLLELYDIKHFTAKELTTPNHKKKAKELGYDNFLPKKEWWVRGIVLATYADYLRDLVDEPIRCRNWWRPTKYNTKVASSSPDSDHPHACAFDLDFKTVEGKKKAAIEVKALYKSEPWLEVSLGFYSNSPRTIHVGFLSPKGRRRWGHH